MVQTSSTITLSSLYSSGQCLLSVLGSIGVILLFAGIPQLIYAPQVNPGSLMTFLLGALLISLMVAGNAFIGYKYRQLVRDRREETRSRPSRPISSEDKPPSYDELLKEEGLPPAYATIIKEKPPRYEELVSEVFDWQIVTKTPEVCQASTAISSSPAPHPSRSGSGTSAPSEEIPIIIPIHSNLTTRPIQSQNTPTRMDSLCNQNLAFQSSSEDLRLVEPSASSSLQPPAERSSSQDGASTALLANEHSSTISEENHTQESQNTESIRL